MELIILIIKLLIKAAESGNKPQGPTQQQIEAWQREQWARQLQQMQEAQRQAGQPIGAVRLPPVLPLPAAAPVPRRKVKRPTPPVIPAFAPVPAAAPAGSDPVSSARLVRPETLRAQFVLSEILKPPVSMRTPQF